MSSSSRTDAADPDPASIFTWTKDHRSHGKPIVGGDVVAWVLTEGHRAATNAELLDQLCWRLVGAGVPVWRATVSITTLHPQLLGFGVRWWRDREQVEEVDIAHGAGRTPDYLDSPMRPAMERGETVRYRLGLDRIDQFPLLVGLRDSGGTDYLACPLTFIGDRHQVITFATDREGGFSDDDVAAIGRVLPAVGIVVEAKAMRRLMANVLDTYLGRTIGRHILNGEIQRRQGEEIRAALIATDLRDFTGLSDRLPAAALIELLDDYFDAVSSPIAAHGGEVLKFVGDGVLAIFVSDSEEGSVRAALDSAIAALARLDALNLKRREQGAVSIRIGVGLHVGAVVYGNVGAVDRLDFTAIGPAVNLVCRLESLTKRLGRPLLMSHDFAALAGRPLDSLGFHPVRGLAEPEEVFGLPVANDG
ncbi:MAG TPA: adenylate/guanylate cyclase domain-containing protein [Stellaceae bacterium]|nr:adenylate/guanylate cyclase domain-containing protein [Stellaceae bacterium]